MSPEQTPLPSQDPSITGGNAVNDDAEKRRQVEEAIGQSLDEAFSNNASAVIHNRETGFNELTLYRLWKDRGEVATIKVAQRVDEKGNRTAFMSFGAKGAWENHWRFTDGPSQERRMVAGKYNDSGEFEVLVPDELKYGSDAYDANSDKEVAFWGKLWPENLKGTPEKPKSKVLKKFGRKVLERVFP